MIDIVDIHTHRLDACRALISVDPRLFAPQPGKWYAVGFHPWHDVDMRSDSDFSLLEQVARHHQVIAIGETGMDSLRGAGLDIQAQVFLRHLELAATLRLPVVVHCVRTAQNILTLRHKAGLDAVTLAIHGFRGNERVARSLLDAGCYLSFGQQFNPVALQATPPGRLLIETDDSATTIDDVAARIAQSLGMTPHQVMDLAMASAASLLRRQ